MSPVNKRNVYLLSLGWWLAKRRLRARALELVHEETPTRKRRRILRPILLIAVVGAVGYVVARRRSDPDHGWISYQPSDLNGAADIAEPAVPASPSSD